MQTTEAIADYTRVTLAGQSTTKGKAKGSKRSAPGDDAPLATPAKQNEEPKVPKILKRVMLFSGPSLLCTDSAQKNSFPFRVTKDQHRFLEDWAEQRYQASNQGVRVNTIMNSLDSARQVSIAVHFSKVPIFSVASSKESTPAASTSSIPLEADQRVPQRDRPKGRRMPTLKQNQRPMAMVTWPTLQNYTKCLEVLTWTSFSMYRTAPMFY
jgi:hypothetical protein